MLWNLAISTKLSEVCWGAYKNATDTYEASFAAKTNLHFNKLYTPQSTFPWNWKHENSKSYIQCTFFCNLIMYKYYGKWKKRHILATVHINGEIIVFSLFCCVGSLMPLALRVSIIRCQRYIPHLGRLHPLLFTSLCSHRQQRRRLGC